MDVMLFATENIYIRTGTSSPHITDEIFSFSLREETSNRIAKMPSVMKDNSLLMKGKFCGVISTYDTANYPYVPAEMT